MLRFVIAAAAAALLVGSARARAADDETLGRRTAVYGILGLGTPVGDPGLEVVRRLGPVLEISVGVGAGLTATLAHSGSPLQWAVMPRLRLGESDRNALTLGAGISGGNFGDIPLFCDEYCDAPRPSYPTHYMLWANLEIGGEHWWEGGFAVRYFLGYAQGCDAAACSSTLALPYFGVGLGYAF